MNRSTEGLLPSPATLHADRDPMAADIRDPEAARYLGRSKSWLRQARMRGEGPCYVKDGRSIRYRLIDLDRYIEKRLTGGDLQNESKAMPKPARNKRTTR